MDVRVDREARSRMPIVATLAVLFAVGATAAIAWAFDVRSHAARSGDRLAVIASVDEIRLGLLSREELGGYVACGAPGEAWRPKPCWAEIGFAPAVPPPGSYEVVISEAGFTVRATADLDGDGEPMEVVATESAAASVRTEPDVW